MPVISIFYGIVIRMFWQEHAPPHFHAEYADDEIVIKGLCNNNFPILAPRIALD